MYTGLKIGTHTPPTVVQLNITTGSQKDDWARKNMRGLQQKSSTAGRRIGLGTQKDQPLYSWAVWYDMHRDRLWSPGTEALVPWDRSFGPLGQKPAPGMLLCKLDDSAALEKEQPSRHFQVQHCYWQSCLGQTCVHKKAQQRR